MDVRWVETYGKQMPIYSSLYLQMPVTVGKDKCELLTGATLFWHAMFFFRIGSDFGGNSAESNSCLNFCMERPDLAEFCYYAVVLLMCWMDLQALPCNMLFCNRNFK